MGAYVRRDRESRRHWQSERTHFRKVGAFAPKQIPIGGAAIRETVAKPVNPFRHEKSPNDRVIPRMTLGHLLNGQRLQCNIKID
jgi:hypothetical protein